MNNIKCFLFFIVKGVVSLYEAVTKCRFLGLTLTLTLAIPLTLGVLILKPSDLFSQQQSRFKNNRSQNNSSYSSNSNQDQDEDSKPKNETVLDDGWSDIVKYSPKEKQKACKQYEGKYVSYYDKVYLIKGCKRRSVEAQSISSTIHPIDTSTFAKFPLDFSNLGKGVSRKESCKSLNNKYVTEGYVYVYYVEQCKLNQFPDWLTFQAHARSKGKGIKDLIEIDVSSYPDLKEGQMYLSVVDQEKSVLDSISNVKTDVIPVKQACRGLNGLDVSYVDKIYRIENCKKREWDSSEYMLKHPNAKLKEISSNQWLSLPDGPTMK